MDTRELILKLKYNPRAVLELQPREFEEVVAELLAGMGWEVNLTPPSRDGGYDILAVSSDQTRLQTSWIVECKKYREDRPVGVEVTRGLLGVKAHIGVPNAIIVSTSGFTGGAIELSQARHDLHLVGADELSDWIDHYAVSPKGEPHSTAKAFLSCFISYSHEDEPFAQKLAAALRRNGVRVWFASDDIRPGERIRDQIKKAIAAFDRLIFVLSESSMKSNWVRSEILDALSREQSGSQNVLFPIGLAPIEEIQRWESFDADSGRDLAREIRSYFIPDFSGWKNPTSFETQLQRVINALHVRDRQEATDQKPSIDMSDGIKKLASSNVRGIADRLCAQIDDVFSQPIENADKIRMLERLFCSEIEDSLESISSCEDKRQKAESKGEKASNLAEALGSGITGIGMARIACDLKHKKHALEAALDELRFLTKDSKDLPNLGDSLKRVVRVTLQG
ncbi:MAG: TIR domain-containing protein [candidate division Zixibacteria bacterium]|nr:TIR domain-containing protein [candidate division Zixibacteria bacterium]MBU1471614.1 TIR domain-containing protein [candidate division Zixibacteria bacterium]MBU2626711.1 TIR domain-containing protein [candidate division Zixibacteria bacterium]